MEFLPEAGWRTNPEIQAIACHQCSLEFFRSTDFLIDSNNAIPQGPLAYQECAQKICYLKGQGLSPNIGWCRLVMILDLSSNNFSGHIPSELMTLQALQSLNLSRNQLKGKIPEKIGDMKLLESFDISLNQLSGELPMSLSSLSFLSSFNVSYNNLTGRVPSGTQLQGFNESSFFGNQLCGDPLTRRCSRIEAPDRDEQDDDDDSHGTEWGLIISTISGFIAGFWVVLTPLIVSTAWRTAYFNFLRDLWYKFYDVIRVYCCNMFPK